MNQLPDGVLLVDRALTEAEAAALYAWWSGMRATLTLAPESEHEVDGVGVVRYRIVTDVIEPIEKV